MVSVQSRYNVFPCEPTPNTKLFSLCEQIKLRTHAPLLYVYKPHPHHNASTFVNTLRHSLSQALVLYYPLAGRLSCIKGAKWELHCNAKGAQLLEANCKEANLNDLGDFVPTHLVSQLIPNIDYDVLPIEDTPLLVAQLTRFPCGGVTIGVALCRAAIDGTATMRFMSTWAKLARKENSDSTEMMPCHDRTLLNSYKVIHSGLTSLHDHSEFDTPPPWLGPLGDNKFVVAIVKITDEQVKKLKHKGNNINIKLNSSTQRPYSTFEVIAGYLWKCVSKARYAGNSEQPTRLSTLVNCRSRMRPPLNLSYAGNAAFPTVTPTRSFGEIMHRPLSFAAGNVRVALEKVTGDFVGSALDHIEKEKDMDLVRYNFHYPAPSVVGKGPYKGNPNLFVVSWMNFSFKDADFGWGKPLYFGPGYMDSEGKAFVMNKVSGDGLVVAISLEASHMDAFKKFFYGDIDEDFPISKI